MAYLDIQGSGAETISHIYDNGRVTFMFNSFDKSPRICRLFSKGRVIECDSPEFPIMLKEMGIELVPGTRAIIIGEVFKVRTHHLGAVGMVLKRYRCKQAVVTAYPSCKGSSYTVVRFLNGLQRWIIRIRKVP